MTEQSPDIRRSRLDKEEIEKNFADLHPPLNRAAALVEADRCYFCYDAPCTTACPTGIDIPVFIQKIRSDNLRGAARTILSENIMGGMCARVCPTEVLCEEVCVRNKEGDKPVEIGLLQRYATDPTIDDNEQLFPRAEATGRRVAVVGGGPAGLSCAHRLAVLGHAVTVFNRDSKGGGLNEYGIAAYKTVDEFAQRELHFILAVGGIELRNGVALGEDLSVDSLLDEYDAVFLAMGLSDSRSLGIDGEDLPGVINAIDYIADLRQAGDKSQLPVGRRVVVIGGGMTAIDIAVQSKRLGAETVDLVYRGGPEKMSASDYEQRLAQTDGVTIHYNAAPQRVIGDEHAAAVEFSANGDGGSLTIEADVVFKAIGQVLDCKIDVDEAQGRIRVDEHFRTSSERVWAGGDCVSGGEDLTVSAVQHGKLAAMDIDRFLRS